MAFQPGDAVQTPFGRGIVREVRNNRRLLVEVRGRTIEVAEGGLAAAPASAPRVEQPRRREPHVPAAAGPAIEIDLHGMTVADALVRVEQALNDAILADATELRLIHGRSGGRIRGALKRRLGELPGIRSFGPDPRNDGVMVVKL